tara:strand:- start:655 stop:1182 length:528 start_codon:yes stop_codon:yes gene_type:complete
MRYDIFPTPVWHIEGAPQQLVDDLYKNTSIIKENIHQYQALEASNQGGYQTTQFPWRDFHPAGIEYIENVVNNIFSPKEPADIGGWWYNINPKGSWNVPHNHAGADYALVFYVTDSDGLLRLSTSYNSRRNEPDHCSFDAKKGDIIIFPGDLVHYVMPNPREEDRISISLNLQLC